MRIGDQAAELHARAEAARRQSQVLAARLRAVRHTTAETVQLIDAAWERAARIHELRQAASADLLRYSAHARLQARLASMPVIEQAKGIIMAQSGCTEDQAFDVLRRASQRQNMKVRDLAAGVVARTVGSAPAQEPARPPRQQPKNRPGQSRVMALTNQGIRR